MTFDLKRVGERRRDSHGTEIDGDKVHQANSIIGHESHNMIYNRGHIGRTQA